MKINKDGNEKRIWAAKMFKLRGLTTFKQIRRHTVKETHTRYIKNIYILFCYMQIIMASTICEI